MLMHLYTTDRTNSAKIDLSVTPLELANGMLFFQRDPALLDKPGLKYFTEVSKEVSKKWGDGEGQHLLNWN